MSIKKCLILLLSMSFGMTSMNVRAVGQNPAGNATDNVRSGGSKQSKVGTMDKEKDVLYNEGKKYFWGIGKDATMDRKVARYKFTFSRIYENELKALFYLGMYSYECISAQADTKEAEKDFKEVVSFVLDQVKKGDAECEYFLGYMKEHGFGGQTQDMNEAFRLYKSAANQGDIIAQNSLGLCYHKGKGVPQNYDLAYEWYKKAADAGNIEATYNLGCLYKDKCEMDEAIKLFREAVNHNCTLAYNELGKCYMYGDGVERNIRRAVYYFERAAIDGNVEAQSHLGIYYLERDDNANAVMWLIKAAKQENADAQCNLGLCYANGYGVKQDYVKAVEWYRKAAEQGDANAQYELGLCYAKGNGVGKDYGEAVKWHKLSAEQGNACAQYELGLCYAKGNGVGKDCSEATRWYKLSAEQGNADAQYELGLCYANGNGVGKDCSEAARWYKLSAEQGNSYAQWSLGLCYNIGYGVGKDYGEAEKWYKLSAEQGNAGAQCNLGFCYANGEGVEKNDIEAAKWYKLSAEQGNACAQCNLGLCYANGYGVKQDYVEAAKWYKLSAEQGNVDAKRSLEALQKEIDKTAKYTEETELPNLSEPLRTENIEEEVHTVKSAKGKPKPIFPKKVEDK